MYDFINECWYLTNSTEKVVLITAISLIAIISLAHWFIHDDTEYTFLLENRLERYYYPKTKLNPKQFNHSKVQSMDYQMHNPKNKDYLFLLLFLILLLIGLLSSCSVLNNSPHKEQQKKVHEFSTKQIYIQ